MAAIMSELAGKRVLLGITGGIAAYKAAELVRLLVKAGAGVECVLTEAAQRFIGAATLQALSGRPVLTSLWAPEQGGGMAHIDGSRDAHVILVAPASADFLAKLAHGHADDLLSTLCLARACPLLVAPAMNLQMWENPATQRNLVLLEKDGIVMLGPDSGEQACGETGPGRMLEPAALVDELVAWFRPKCLAGRHVMITAGPTYEAIDPVRGLTNRSSGRMGYALARAARAAGAVVTLVSGPTALPTPRGVERVDVTSAREMRDAVMARIDAQHIFIAVAAVADFRPATSTAHKLKKGTAPLSLDLAPNPDILAEVAALPKPPLCVGFAAETEHLVEHAREKLARKRVRLIVANPATDTLAADTIEMTLVDESGARALPPLSKDAAACALIEEICSILDSGT